MGISSSFASMIFNLIIVFAIVYGLKKRLGAAGRKAGRRGSSAQNGFNDMLKTYNAANANKTVLLKKHDGMTLQDDRNSDWMAMQLREEARAMARVSEMFKLKQQHMNNCDAEFIKRFHESSCDANGIDDGTHKRSGK